MLPRSAWLAVALICFSFPALADLVYTCDASIGSATCADLNGSSVSGVYSSIFSSSLTADIYITYGNVGLGQSNTPITSVSYSTYYNALAASTDDPTALASLGTGGDPLGSDSNDQVDITPALANELNITANNANTNGLEADGVTSCTLGTSGCYNGVITIASGVGYFFPSSPSAAPPSGPPYLYDFYSIVEHETDEVLGTFSCIGAQSGAAYDQCNSFDTNAAAPDLFRYASPGTRSFLNSASGTPAYFSIDGGVTDIADYNNSPNGEDYGDWIGSYPYMVQDAEGSSNASLDISTDAGTNSNQYPRPEVAVLDAIGYNLIVAPEPGTFGLLAAGFTALVLFGGRARRSV